MAVTVTPQAIKELRERTQAGMSDCKSALTEAEGDMEKAVEIILKKGLVKSAKRAGAVASEGEVRASVAADKKTATIVEVNIQTDFAARNDQFRAFVGEVLAAVEQAPDGTDAATVMLPSGKNIGDTAVDLTARIGEKIVVRRWNRVSAGAGVCGSYVHMGGKIGVILAVNADHPDHAEVVKFIDDTAMHAAAMAPLVLQRSEVTEAQIAKQREIYEAQMAEDPKMASKKDSWPKIIDGKVNKWFSEVALLEHESVVTPGQTIAKLAEAAAKASGGKVEITKFVRYERGEGIEKAPSGDFASEVAKMAAG